MTATVHVLHDQAPPPLPLLPEQRKLLLDWLACLETGGYTDVPEDVTEALLGACACPDLTAEQRQESWDGVLTWVDLREGFRDRRMLPEAIGCWDYEDAENTAAANAEDAKSLLVHGNTTARGGGITPRGTA